MIKISQYIFTLIIIFISGYFLYQNNLPVCDKVVEYSIGRFDKNFGISEGDFIKSIQQAESVWENILNKNIFVYKEGAKFKINLIYDERQIAITQKQKTEFGLTSFEGTFKDLDTKFENLKGVYDTKIDNYESDLSLFKERQNLYEKRVSFWNNKDGAPKNEYDYLKNESIYLNNEATRLREEVIEINKISKNLEDLLRERNKKAGEYNKMVEAYNEKYNDNIEFDQAEYVDTGGFVLPIIGDTAQKQINIYQFTNKKDLILALTHEFGHALGMDHVDNYKSIMYFMTYTDVENVPSPTKEDLIELNRVCK